MPLATVRFDRIFDVVHGMRSRKEVTYFGFESAGLKKYGVAAPGNIELRPGSLVTVFLREVDNWQSLVGWVDHATGEVTIEDPSYEYFSLVLCVIAVVVIFLSLASSPALAALALSIVASWAVWCALSLRALRRANAELQQVKRNLASLGTESAHSSGF